MKRIIKIILSSSITLSLWFYFDNLTDRIKAILFPKKTILKEIYKETREEKNNEAIEQINVQILESKKDKTWLDYILWGNEDYYERLKEDGIWNTLWRPFLTSDNNVKPIKEVTSQPLSTHETVVKTDEMIKDNAVKSVDYVSNILSDYFQNNMSWIDYLIIQGFKLLAIFIFFLIIYGIFTLLLNIMKKDKKV